MVVSNKEGGGAMLGKGNSTHHSASLSTGRLGACLLSRLDRSKGSKKEGTILLGKVYALPD
jgi:hypothetical protein